MCVLVLCTQVNMMFVIYVTLHECASTPGKLVSLLGHGGNRTRDLWDNSPMLCQLSYVVKSVRVDDISVLRLVPSIPVYSMV